LIEQYPQFKVLIMGKVIIDDIKLKSELEEHAFLLFLAFLKYHSDHAGGWRAKAHHDGTRYESWFLVGTEVNGRQIGYHLPNYLWDKAWWLEEYDRAPVEWDGHTSQDVIQRLEAWLEKT
jgi:hypothetical protein